MKPIAELAIALVLANPHWSNEKIASLLGCSPEYLAMIPGYFQVRKILRDAYQPERKESQCGVRKIFRNVAC